MECFSNISFCVWGPILDGGSKIDLHLIFTTNRSVCLSKKEETTCIGNGNSGENPKRFNVKERRHSGLFLLRPAGGLLVRRGLLVQNSPERSVERRERLASLPLE